MADLVGVADLVAILLAAGRGTRFDPSGARLKLLQPVPSGPHKGALIAVAAARNLGATGLAVLAVVRDDDTSEARALREALAREGCALLVNPAADAGMGGSLALGVAHAREAAGWIVALADMPAIAPDTIARVAAELRRGGTTVAPAFNGQRGHPVGFAASLADELIALSGDSGAREVLRRHPPQLVAVDDPGVLLDIDTPASLQ